MAEWRENRMQPAQTRTSAATYPSKRRFSRRFEDCCIDHPSKHTQQAVGSTRTDPYPFLQRSPQPRSTLRAYPAVNCRRQCHRTAARSPETIRKKAPSARLRCKQSRLKLIIALRSPTRSPVGVRTYRYPWNSECATLNCRARTAPFTTLGGFPPRFSRVADNMVVAT